METLKKTLLLTNKNEKGNKTLSTLTLEKKNSNIFCTMKCYYNIPNGNLILGLQVNDKIIKQNISFDNNPYNFILSDKIDLKEKISCVLLENKKNEFIPIIWGSENSNNYKSHILQKLRESVNKISSIKVENKTKEQPTNNLQNNIHNNIEDRIENSNENNQYNLDTQPKGSSPHSIIMDNIEEEKFSNYSQISMIEENVKDKSEIAVAQASLFEYTDDEVEKTIDENISSSTPHNFYNMLAEQIDELFDKYPREYNLEKLIDSSKWVKITYESDSKPYVVGLIFDGDNIKYICYGVPGKYDTPQPNELIGYSQWLPTDVNDPYNNGYWVMYQDADTGENILIE